MIVFLDANRFFDTSQIVSGRVVSTDKGKEVWLRMSDCETVTIGPDKADDFLERIRLEASERLSVCSTVSTAKVKRGKN